MVLEVSPMLTNVPGTVLVSTGDDGTARIWKRTSAGTWAEYAESDLGAAH